MYFDIRTMMDQEFKDIAHQFDPWHFVKVIKLMVIICQHFLYGLEYPNNYLEPSRQTSRKVVPDDQQTPLEHLENINW